MEKYGEKPKIFTKKWFENIWYYYHKPVIITIVIIAALASIFIFCDNLAVRDYDVRIMYGGNGMGMSSREALMLEDIAKSVCTDATGDGKVLAHVEYCCVEGNNKKQEDMITFDTQLIYGDSIMYFVTEQTLPRVTGYFSRVENDGMRYDDVKRYNLYDLCEKYNISADRRVTDESGAVCAVNIADNPIFEEIDLDSKSGGKGLYFAMRNLRAGEIKEDSETFEKIMKNHEEFAEYIIKNIPAEK